MGTPTQEFLTHTNPCKVSSLTPAKPPPPWRLHAEIKGFLPKHHNLAGVLCGACVFSHFGSRRDPPSHFFSLALVGLGVFPSPLQGRVTFPTRPVCPRKIEFHGLKQNYPQQIVSHQTQNKKNKLDNKLIWQVSHDRSVLLTDKLQQAGRQDPYEVEVQLSFLLQLHDPQRKHKFSQCIFIQWSILDTSDPCKSCSSIYQVALCEDQIYLEAITGTWRTFFPLFSWPHALEGSK